MKITFKKIEKSVPFLCIIINALPYYRFAGVATIAGARQNPLECLKENIFTMILKKMRGKMTRYPIFFIDIFTRYMVSAVRTGI